MNTKTKENRKKLKVRSKMIGTEVRPRLSVHRSSRFIYVQAIDDVNSRTMLASSDKKLALKGTKGEKAQLLGKKFAELLKEKSINTAIYDRGQFVYKGRVKALAESLREAGIKI